MVSEQNLKEFLTGFLLYTKLLLLNILNVTKMFSKQSGEIELTIVALSLIKLNVK